MPSLSCLVVISAALLELKVELVLVDDPGADDVLLRPLLPQALSKTASVSEDRRTVLPGAGEVLTV